MAGEGAVKTIMARHNLPWIYKKEKIKKKIFVCAYGKRAPVSVDFSLYYKTSKNLRVKCFNYESFSVWKRQVLYYRDTCGPTSGEGRVVQYLSIRCKSDVGDHSPGRPVSKNDFRKTNTVFQGGDRKWAANTFPLGGREGVGELLSSLSGEVKWEVFSKSTPPQGSSCEVEWHYHVVTQGEECSTVTSP